MSTLRRHAVTFAKRIAAALVRRQVRVDATDLARSSPVSKVFGGERGTPIDRHYIEQFLRAHAPVITGDVLEIGGSRYTQQFGRAVRSSGVLHATHDLAGATIVGDLTAPASLPAASVDCLICTQTLGFIFDVKAAVDGIHHLLRPGGTVLATVGGISQISRHDMDRWGDYWRFTDAAVRRLFDDRFTIELVTFGNVAASIGFLQGLAVEDLPDPAVLDHRDPDYQLVIAVAATRRGKV